MTRKISLLSFIFSLGLVVFLCITSLASTAIVAEQEQPEVKASELFISVINDLYTGNEGDYTVIDVNGNDITSAFITQNQQLFNVADYDGIKLNANDILSSITSNVSIVQQSPPEDAIDVSINFSESDPEFSPLQSYGSQFVSNWEYQLLPSILGNFEAKVWSGCTVSYNRNTGQISSVQNPRSWWEKVTHTFETITPSFTSTRIVSQTSYSVTLSTQFSYTSTVKIPIGSGGAIHSETYGPYFTRATSYVRPE